MAFKYSPFTKKQLQLLTWWTNASPHKDKNGVIAEGSVRSGKTLIMSLSFVLWAMEKGDRLQYGICGKTIGSLRRNVITGLKTCLVLRGYKVQDRPSSGHMLVSKRINGKWHVNTFFLFGGRDERSQDLVQGVTLAGVLFDEVALMPESFVNQAMARCSIEGSKFWFNCNPEGPKHWFKLAHVDLAEQKDYLRLHFGLDDNPSLSEAMKQRYRTMFTGVFYRRFILGEWVFADGVIYDCFDEEKNTYSEKDKGNVVPIRILEHDHKATYGSDYGTTNPMVYLESYIFRSKDDPVPFIYVDNEYYWDSKVKYHQKSDEEYVEDFYKFNNGIPYNRLIIDPSATSLTVAHKRKGTIVQPAKNDVIDGIRLTYTLMQMGHILINKDNCPNLIVELGTYSWNAKAALVGKEEPIKENDHACDALRYIVNTCINPIEVYKYKPHGKGRAA